MAFDRYPRTIPGVGFQATGAFSITPDDDNDLPEIPIAVYVGTGGDLVVILRDDEDPVTFKNIPDGKDMSIRPRRVLESSTAEDLVGYLHGTLRTE